MICLIRPPAVESWRLSSATVGSPLGLAYLAGTLEAQSIDFSVVDAVALAPKTMKRYHKGYLVGLPLEEIPLHIPADTTIVGISIIFTHEWPAVVRLIDYIRTMRPEIRIICGGEHITSMPEFSMMTSKADFLVLGEGEEILVDLLEALETGASLKEIDGLVCRDGSTIVTNRRRARRISLDDIPRPAWHKFDVETYSKHGYMGGMDSPDLTIPLLASRGCPYQCTFCSSPNMWTTRWIARDPKLVVDEMEYYIEKFGARNFPFQDLTAIIKKDWIVSICNEIINRKLKISWQLPTGTRSEVIDAEVAHLLKQSGQIAMTYAPESGSDQTRRYIKKKVDTDRMVQSICDCREANLNIMSNLIIGFPHETKELVAENIPFAKRMRAAGCEDLAIMYYMALPGTEIFNSLFDAGKVRVDGAYFRHILQGVSLWPTLIFNDGKISKLGLLYWKLRISLIFYGEKGPGQRKGGLAKTFLKMFQGLFTREHNSRLQTAFRHSIISGLNSLKVQFENGWLPRNKEEKFFRNWHEIFSNIRHSLLTNGVMERMPADTSLIHKSNAVQKIRHDHETARVLVSPENIAANG